MDVGEPSRGRGPLRAHQQDGPSSGIEQPFAQRDDRLQVAVGPHPEQTGHQKCLDSPLKHGLQQSQFARDRFAEQLRSQQRALGL